MPRPDAGDIWFYNSMHGAQYYLVLKATHEGNLSENIVLTNLLCLGHTDTQGSIYILDYNWDVRHDAWKKVA